jgi:molecular chaperone GrpE
MDGDDSKGPRGTKAAEAAEAAECAASGAAEGAPEGGGAAAPAAAAAAAAETELARLAGELEIARGRLLEVMADRDNQAKRFMRERQVVRDEITARCGREMIEVLDNLDLVLQSLSAADRAAPLARGVELTRVVFLDKLRGFGIEPIVTEGEPFNPFHHEAILEEERGDIAPGTIVGEISRGYRMGAQLVRAAKVRVARAPAAASPPAGSAEAK